MKLSRAQQEIVNCLGDGYSMIQAYDNPIHLESKTYYSNSIPREVTCSNPTKNKLLALGLIDFTQVDSSTFYRLTDLGRSMITGKPTDWTRIGSDSEKEE